MFNYISWILILIYLKPENIFWILNFLIEIFLKILTFEAWKSFSWVFKRGLILFFQIKFWKDFYFTLFFKSCCVILSWYHLWGLSKVRFTSRLAIFLVSLVSSSIQLISLSTYYDVLIHKCMKQDQSYFDKSFISEKTIWFEL